MISKEKIESYMTKLSLSFSEVAENTWVINDTEKGLENVFVVSSDPVVLVRVKVMDLTPEYKKSELYEELLILNASDLIYGAYALEENSVILQNALKGETMDLEEFQETLDAITLALVQHYKILNKYRAVEK